MKPPWSTLSEMAQAEVVATRAALPESLRDAAQNVSILLENLPSQQILDEGFEPDLLGLFIGSPLGEMDSDPTPPQILLYLDNLWEASDEDAAIFREEVRITYLHELGHYLGLEENDLEDRGLL